MPFFASTKRLEVSRRLKAAAREDPELIVKTADGASFGGLLGGTDNLT